MRAGLLRGPWLLTSSDSELAMRDSLLEVTSRSVRSNVGHRTGLILFQTQSDLPPKYEDIFAGVSVEEDPPPAYKDCATTRPDRY